MAQKKQKELTPVEMEIVDLYLNDNKSIREISSMYVGFGRTKIQNILKKYAQMSEENANEVELKKLSQKNHKEVGLKDEVNLDLSKEQIKNAYMDIIEHKKSLTQAASELGVNRDTLSNAIIKYLGTPGKIKQYKEVLKENVHNKDWNCYTDEEFDELPENIKKKVIFEKFKSQRRKTGRDAYSEDTLERKFNRLVNCFEERNDKIENIYDRITRNELLRMMFDSPNLLTLSVSNKIKPVLNILDYTHFDFKTSSQILKNNPIILSTSLERTNLQIRILKDTDTLEYVLKKPKTLRTSPEFMYALIKRWERDDKKGSPFISTEKLFRLYKETSTTLTQKFDIKNEYGDDEYFDRI